MKKEILSLKKSGLVLAMLITGTTFSQTQKDTVSSKTLEDVVVTGVVNPKSKIKSSVSITTLNAAQVQKSSSRTLAEIFRTIPGIRSESSGGEGNANIAVRGVPISSGGSKYLQLQEDGLPVLLFGDIAFATSDIFTRFDNNISRIEAIRGGSASILSSNSPGGIINFISKTGKTEGGSMGTSFGLDYSSFRTDIDYGTKIGDGLYFHAGGFYRTGDGIRPTGFNSNNGGQMKFNLTKEFSNGSITVYTKFLNDRAAAFMPMPVKVTGTNDDPTWESIPGFDATHATNHTAYLQTNSGPNGEGAISRRNVADGMNPISKSIGISANFDLEDDWKISENARYSSNNGNFITPFPAEVASAASIANSFGAGSTLSYANGDGAFNNPNGLVSRIHMFDVTLNNFNNFMNDIKVTKKLDKVSLTFGYFKSMQNISMSWLWNSYLQEVSDNNARLINVTTAGGASLSDNGLYAYGVPYWGNCCTRNYDTEYNVSAPYINGTLEANDKLTLDLGFRYDVGKVTGSFAGGAATVMDVNNNGSISAPESSVFGINPSSATVVNYGYKYLSFSAGANYLLSEKQSVFFRMSKGASAKADRILFSGLNYMDGSRVNSLDFLFQQELGYKQKFEKGSIYATLFRAFTDEQVGFEATNPTQTKSNSYTSIGIELDGNYNVNNIFSVRGGLTYTKAEITEDGALPATTNNGNQPRRQPKLMYNFSPTINFESKANLGLSFVGQTKSYTQDDNKLVMKGFMIMNLFGEVKIINGLSLNLSVNNLLNTLAFTEAEEGSITAGAVNYIRARPMPGRSISSGLTYKF
jgi:outer membrane receptor protein involved in Fe transport